ncbi:hypothetical protein, partial [Thiolapillus sp.]|uniref:hypothetical protein n=1 Tax=Thiolapillus sp. TaxID=2017437 RepID=UPI003AF991F9
MDNRMQLESIELGIDRDHQAIRIRFMHPGRPVITSSFLKDLEAAQGLMTTVCEQDQARVPAERLRYLVLSSRLPQACLRPRDRFWDIPVPKIDSAFDNL